MDETKIDLSLQSMEHIMDWESLVMEFAYVSFRTNTSYISSCCIVSVNASNEALGSVFGYLYVVFIN